MDKLDSLPLISTINQLEQIFLQLKKVLQVDFKDKEQIHRLNRSIEEIKTESQALANRIQLMLYQEGIDRRVANDVERRHPNR